MHLLKRVNSPRDPGCEPQGPRDVIGWFLTPEQRNMEGWYVILGSLIGERSARDGGPTLMEEAIRTVLDSLDAHPDLWATVGAETRGSVGEEGGSSSSSSVPGSSSQGTDPARSQRGQDIFSQEVRELVGAREEFGPLRRQDVLGAPSVTAVPRGLRGRPLKTN